MYLIPNLTLILMQLLPFLVTLIGMYVIIFKPMLEYLDSRNEQIQGSQKQALVLAEEAKQKAEEAQKDLLAAKKRANLVRQKGTEQAMKEYTEQISKARRESYVSIQEAEKEIAKESQIARESLQITANSIASEISSRILGRHVS
jgi:F-type H+-transporting ATPase subunit b